MNGVRWVGDRAFLVDFPDAATRRVAHASIRAHPPTGLIDLVPAARSVLLRFATSIDAHNTEPDLVRLLTQPVERPADADSVLQIPTVYDGLDLDEVAQLCGWTPTQLIAWHSGQIWTVDFGGFLPGFGYLVPENPGPTIPRRSSPRTKIPAGSVALAGEWTGVYPQASPGGWQLIGRTNLPIWDAHRQPPALLTPGQKVQFNPVETMPAPPIQNTFDFLIDTALEVVRADFLALIEDLGRIGHGALGVPEGGAADRTAHNLANRLVGNENTASSIECLLGGLTLRTHQDVLIAATGAPALLLVNGRLIPWSTPVFVSKGSTIRLGTPHYGLRSYLGVRGGIAGPQVFGSRSSDPTTGLGRPPLRPGDRLGLADDTRNQPQISDLAVSQHRWGDVRLRVHLGPGIAHFPTASLDAFFGTAWQVSSQADRVGVRLTCSTGVRIGTKHSAAMPSEGVIRGTVQVPPSGEPVIFLADHPTTGGYPVIAVVVDADTDALAQCRPGDVVRFTRYR